MNTIKKLSAAPNTFDYSQDTYCTTITYITKYHPLSLVSRNYRNIYLTEHISTNHRYPQKPVTHILQQQPTVDETYEQIIEQPHTTNFRSQNNLLFGPR